MTRMQPVILALVALPVSIPRITELVYSSLSVFGASVLYLMP